MQFIIQKQRRKEREKEGGRGGTEAVKKVGGRKRLIWKQNLPSPLLHLCNASSNLVDGLKNKQSFLVNVIQNRCFPWALLGALENNVVLVILQCFQIVHVKIELDPCGLSPALAVNNLETQSAAKHHLQQRGSLRPQREM